MSFPSRKKIILVFILVQLIALPVILYAVKNQQETRSRASEKIQTQAPPQNGMAAAEQVLEEDQVSTFQQKSQGPTQTAAIQRTQGISRNPKIKKEVYAFIWYPYADSDSDNADSYLQYPYMTTLVYAGLSLKKDGQINKNNTPYQVWKSQRFKRIMTDAKASGVKIHPRIATFDSDRVNYLLATKERRQKAIANIISEIKNAPVAVDGVNIDFEPVSTQSRDEFTDFIKNLRSEMDKINPDLEIVIDTFASTAKAEGGFNLAKLNQYVDGYFIMSFSLVQKDSSEKAGSFNPYSAYVKVVDQYLEKVPADKIIMGFPFYTNRWSTKDNSLRAAKKDNGGGGLILYKDAHAEAKAYGKQYNDSQKAAWYSYYECADKPGWRQVYFDDEQALTGKFQIANTKNLKGVGFWTFNQDRSLDTWLAIYNSFADKTSIDAPTQKQGAKDESYKPNPNCKSPKASKTPTPSPTSTIQPNATALTMVVGLDGIGVTSRIPLGGNKNPKNKNRTLEVKIYKASDNSLVFSGNQVFSFNSSANRFYASISLHSSFETGIYNIYALGNPFLTARYPGSITLTKGQTTTLSSDSFNLITGDVNKTEQSKNLLNILDYNVVLSCSVFSKDTARSVCNQNSEYLQNSDLNDDGIVNQNDITLFIKEMGNQSGATIPTPTPTRPTAIQTSTPTPMPQTGVGPRPAPHAPNGITVPASIDRTGTTDVTAALQSWINNQPDGTAASPTVLIFPAGTTYRMNTGLRIDNRRYITFWGYGSTLRPIGNGSTTGNSGFRLQNSNFIKILGFRIKGANTDAGTASAYHSGGYEYSMGVALVNNSDDIEIGDNWISHVFGDAIYISYDPTGYPDRINMHHNLLELTGRQGIVPDAGSYNKIEWNIIRDIAMSAIDTEDARGASVSLGPLYIRNNLIDRWMHFGTPAYYYTCHALPMDYAAGTLSSMHDIYIENNTFQGGCIGPGNTFQQSNDDADISMWGDMPKSNIFIKNNTFNLPINQRTGWAIRLNNVTRGEVTGNTIPGQTVQCSNCTNVTKQ